MAARRNHSFSGQEALDTLAQCGIDGLSPPPWRSVSADARRSLAQWADFYGFRLTKSDRTTNRLAAFYRRLTKRAW